MNIPPFKSHKLLSVEHTVFARKIQLFGIPAPLISRQHTHSHVSLKHPIHSGTLHQLVDALTARPTTKYPDLAAAVFENNNVPQMSVEPSTVTIPESIGPYIFRQMIGRGGFSLVYTALHEPTKTQVAIKVIPRSRLAPDKFARELLLMKKLDHPFIVAFYDFLEDADNYYLVMEYCERGTLLERVTQLGGLAEPTIKAVMCELVSALDYLHNEIKVAHRDIKLENIMFDRSDHIRLIDFGLGREFSGNGAVLQTACGSPVYASPEMLSGQMYGIASDVWSAGVVLYAMAYGRLPFQATNLQRLITMIQMEEPEYEDRISPELIDLMKRMLVKDVDLRITVQQIRMHGWLFGDLRMKAFGPRFGLDNHWRFKDGCFIVSEEILSKLRDAGVADIDEIREELREGVFNSRTAVYRMERREQVMAGLSAMKFEGRFEKRANSIPKPTAGNIPPEMKSILQKMKGNKHEENKSLPLPPLNRTTGPDSIKLSKGVTNRAVKSLNPRQTHAMHQVALTIMAQFAPIKRRTRALSSTASEADPPPIASVRHTHAQMV